jgi:hypothetical protein
MKEILLITTKGCEGCSIMRASINKALALTKKEGIYFHEIDVEQLREENITLYNKLKLRDFPTTVFAKDNIFTRKEVGTRPYIVILRWIDIDFK